MLKIGTETPAMAEAIYRIHFEAFGRPDEGRLVNALRQGDTFVPELSLVAELDGDLVGRVPDEVFMVWAKDWNQMKFIRGKVVYPEAFAGL